MDDDYIDAVVNFVDRFELVFDNDWEMTKSIIQDPKYYIEEDGTFLEPRVEDESNNWANRGGLLASYRKLKKLMLDRGQKTSLDEDWPSH